MSVDQNGCFIEFLNPGINLLRTWLECRGVSSSNPCLLNEANERSKMVFAIFAFGDNANKMSKDESDSWDNDITFSFYPQ